MAAEKCPKCGKGPRVEHHYEYAGMEHDDSYCGACGKNWPASKGGKK